MKCNLTFSNDSDQWQDGNNLPSHDGLIFAGCFNAYHHDEEILARLLNSSGISLKLNSGGVEQCLGCIRQKVRCKPFFMEKLKSEHMKAGVLNIIRLANKYDEY